MEFDLEAKSSSKDQKLCVACVGAVFQRTHALAAEKFIVRQIMFFVVATLKIISMCCWNFQVQSKLGVRFSYGTRLIALSEKTIIWMH